METSPFFEEKMDKNNLYSGLFIGVIGKSRKNAVNREIKKHRSELVNKLHNLRILAQYFQRFSKTLIEPRFTGLMNFNWVKNILKKAACRIAHGFFTSITGPTLPSLAENTKVSVAEVSTIFSYRGLGNIVGAILAGIFFNRLPSGKIKLLSIVRGLIC